MSRPVLIKTNTNSTLLGESIICANCQHGNVILAKFCGKCGCRLEKAIVSTTLNGEPTPDRLTYRHWSYKVVSVFAGVALEILIKFKNQMLAVDFAYKTVLATAMMLVLFSGFLSYLFLNDTSTVKVSHLSFTDVSLDHPIYSSCKNLLKIKGIGYRNSLRLAPHERISVAEWNYSVKKAIDYLGQDTLNTLFFESKEEVTATEIKKKLKDLKLYGETIQDDVSRISAFVCLEKAIFEGGSLI